MSELKKYFLLDPHIHYLNHGSFGATPMPVFSEYQRWQLELERQPVEFLGRRVEGLLRKSREALASYLGTEADHLVYTQNVTIALNIIARSLELGPGDEVLVSDHEYGAMDRMWRFLSRERGFTCVHQTVELASHTALVESFWAGVTPRTRIIYLSHVTSPTAIIFPIEEIIRRARAAGIITVIDGAHAPGQIPLDLASLGADFYGGNLHKWLCAPKGAGFLYARPEVQSLLKPLVISWGYEAELPGSSLFVDHHEGWGTRDVAAFLTVPAAIEFQREHDWDAVRASCHLLARKAQSRIGELTGLEPLHSQSATWFAQMAAALLPLHVDIAQLKLRLYDEHRIEIPLTAWKDRKLIRVSVQGYNSPEDIDILVNALRSLLRS